MARLVTMYRGVLYSASAGLYNAVPQDVLPDRRRLFDVLHSPQQRLESLG